MVPSHYQILGVLDALGAHGDRLRGELHDLGVDMGRVFGQGVAELFDTTPELDRVEVYLDAGGELDVRASFGGDLSAYYYCEDGALVECISDTVVRDPPPACERLQELFEKVRRLDDFVAWVARTVAEAPDSNRRLACLLYVREQRDPRVEGCTIPDP